jgi:general secretion pathway protein H
MTLMELMVVVTIVALVMAGLSLGVGSLTRQRLVTSSVRVAAIVRTAYSHAATSGKTVRVVFDLDSGAFWMEEAEGGNVVLAKEDDEEAEEGSGEQATSDKAAGPLSAKAQAEALSAVLGDDPDKLLGAAKSALEADDATIDFGALGALGGLSEQTLEIETPRYRAPSFKAVEGARGRRARLEPGVAFVRVETEHRERPAEEGKAYLYFFPAGLTELAVIQLRDSRGFVNSVEVHALTGRCRIHDVPYELPSGEEERNEAREAG